MEYNPRGYNAENNESSVDSIFNFINYIVKKWWLVVIVAFVCAIIGFAYAKINYVPKYSSNIKFVANNRADGTISTGQSSSDLIAGSTLANNYRYLLTTTRGLLEKVADEIDGMDYIQVARSVKANVITDTSLIDFTVTTNDPEKSYKIAMAFKKHYEDFAQSAFPSTTLKVFDNPYKAESANADNSIVLYTIAGFIIGAFAVIGICCLIVAAKDTIKSSDEVSGRLELRLLGTVGKVSKKNSKDNVLITDKSSGFSFVFSRLFFSWSSFWRRYSARKARSSSSSASHSSGVRRPCGVSGFGDASRAHLGFSVGRTFVSPL